MSASNLRQRLLAAVNRAEQAEEATAGVSSSRPQSTLSSRQQSVPVNQSTRLQHTQGTTGTGSVVQRSFLWNTSSLVGKKRNRGGGGKKKKKLPSWTHTYVCLASPTQRYVPDSDERATLQLAGLGEKKISIDAYSEAEDIHQDLLYHYPKLKEGGGYELLRAGEGGGKVLQVIACPESGYSVTYLRAVVHHAKIYIRPLQRNLNTDPEITETRRNAKLPKEECGEFVPIASLREHIVKCGQSPVVSVDSDDSDLPPGPNFDLDNLDVPQDSPAEVEAHVYQRPLLLKEEETARNLREGNDTPSSHIEQEETNPLQPPREVNSDYRVSGDDDDVICTEDVMLEAAIRQSEMDSMQESQHVDQTCMLGSTRESHIRKTQINSMQDPKSLSDVVTQLKRKYSQSGTYDMVVRRSRVLSDAFKRMQRDSFSPCFDLKVEFVGEAGCDTGGLRREFFTLVYTHMSKKYLTSTGSFIHDAVALQEDAYFHLGQLIAMSIIQGGAPVNNLCLSVYNFLCGFKPQDIIIHLEEVPEHKDVLEMMSGAETVEELQQLAYDQLDLIKVVDSLNL